MPGMTTWSVVKDDTSDGRRRVRLPRHLPRLALVVCLALIVVTLGMVVRPGNPPEPPQPSQSDRARAAALADALDLRSAGERLAATGADASPGAGTDASRTAVEGTVSLLTTQARALLRPGQPAGSPASAGTGTGSGPGSATATPATAPATAGAPSTPAALAAGLAASGRQRLADAASADGGTARLLAVIGTGQLLQATSLAATAGAPDPSAGRPGAAESPAATPSAAATACPSAPQAAEADGQSGGPTAAATRHADLPNALAAVISTERETVYGYQVALTRLDGPGAATAAAQLTRHEALATAAEAQARLHCVPVPPREAGYALDPSFLASPAAGLAGLETGSLAPYADLVALSDGSTRHWAVSGLLEAARRAVQWGAKPGSMPGLAEDPAAFPTLPAG